MSFLMSLRDDDTYTYIKNNLVFTGPPVVPIQDRFVPPYDLVGGKYYSWVFNGTYWVLTDNDSTVYTETEPPNQSTTAGSGAPTKIIPYNGYGYYAIGASGSVKIKKIDFSTNMVTTIQAYSVTYTQTARTDATLYGNYAVFHVVVGDNASYSSVSNISCEIIKVSLTTESCTQLYSADLPLTYGELRSIGIGCDGTNVYASIGGLSAAPDIAQYFYVPFGGGSRTNIGDGSIFDYGDRGYIRGRSGEIYYYTDSATKTWDVGTNRLNDHGMLYIVDDSSYPVYIICSTDSEVSAIKLNADESSTLISELLSGIVLSPYDTFMPCPVLRAEGRSVLYFPSNIGSLSSSAEVHLPYKDVI